MRAALLLLVLLSACAGEGNEMEKLTVTSVFKNGERIPNKYTCRGEDISPPLSIGNLSNAVKSIAIIMDDPDAPGGTFLHWVIWNLPPKTEVQEGTQDGANGMTDFGTPGYGGPCPPPGKPHRYFFRVYALDSVPEPSSAARKGLEAAMKGHILAQGELVGTYSR